MRNLQLKAARGAGERFIFAVFWWFEDGTVAALDDFLSGEGGLFNDKNSQVFAVAPSFLNVEAQRFPYPVCPG
jgi:hypothetical protein